MYYIIYKLPLYLATYEAVSPPACKLAAKKKKVFKFLFLIAIWH